MIKKFISRLLGKGAAPADATAPAVAPAAPAAAPEPAPLAPTGGIPTGKRVEVPVSAHGIDPKLVDERAINVVRTLQRAWPDTHFTWVIGRLEAKGWVRREADPLDKRRKLLWVTPEGEKAVQRMKRAVARAQGRILGPLQADEQAQLLVLLGKLVAGHEAGA